MKQWQLAGSGWIRWVERNESPRPKYAHPGSAHRTQDSTWKCVTLNRMQFQELAFKTCTLKEEKCLLKEKVTLKSRNHELF